MGFGISISPLLRSQWAYYLEAMSSSSRPVGGVAGHGPRGRRRTLRGSTAAMLISFRKHQPRASLHPDSSTCAQLRRAKRQRTDETRTNGNRNGHKHRNRPNQPGLTAAKLVAQTRAHQRLERSSPRTLATERPLPRTRATERRLCCYEFVPCDLACARSCSACRSRCVA
jgi:hypothetical protein